MGYFEYLIPYLNMEMRRKILSNLNTQDKNSPVTIYDLLVNLRGGKDADMLVSTIKLIAKKVY